jgi:ribosomal protein S18 acetylase RimI-like enzyme
MSGKPMSSDYLIRLGTQRDAATSSLLHSSRITEGFLPTLGPRFLARLYRRIALDRDSFLMVAEKDGEIIAMAACTGDLGHLYRVFILRDGLIAAASALLPILRSLPRVLETLKYPSQNGSEPAKAPLPEAEVLAVAVREGSSGLGVGRQIMVASIAEFTRRGVASFKVITSSENAAALALYRSTGFRDTAALEVHEGTDSLALVWSTE